MGKRRKILKIISAVTVVLFLWTNVACAVPFGFGGKAGRKDSCLAIDAKEQFERIVPYAVAIATPLLLHSEFARNDIDTLAELSKKADEIKYLLVRSDRLRREDVAKYSFLLFSDPGTEKKSYYYFNEDGYFLRVSEEEGVKDPFYVAFLEGLDDGMGESGKLNSYHFETYKISSNNAGAIYTAVSKLVEEKEVAQARSFAARTSDPSRPGNADFLATYVPHIGGHGLPGVNDVIEESGHNIVTGEDLFQRGIGNAREFLEKNYAFSRSADFWNSFQVDLVKPKTSKITPEGFLGLVFISPQIWQYVHIGKGREGKTPTFYITQMLNDYLRERYSGISVKDTNKYEVYITALIIHEIVERFTDWPHLMARRVHREYLRFMECRVPDERDGLDELEELFDILTQEYIGSLDKSIYEPIDEWTGIFQKMAEDAESEMAEVNFVLHLEGEETRVFTYNIPKDELQAGGLSPFVEYYLKTQLYNLMTSRGAEKIGIYTSLTGVETDRLVSWAESTFPKKVPNEITETDQKPLYTYIVSRLSEVYRVRFEFYKAEKDEVEKYTADDVEEEAVYEDLSKLKELKGVNIGIDAGGRDVKVVVYKDGERVFSKVHNWTPTRFLDADKHIETVEYLIRLAVVALKLPDVSIDPSMQGMREALSRIADKEKGPDITIEEIKEFVEFAQNNFGIGEDSQYVGIDSIGISWPDTVVDDQIRAWSKMTHKVGLAATAREMASRYGIDISRFTDDEEMVQYVRTGLEEPVDDHELEPLEILQRRTEFEELRQMLYRREIRRRIRPMAEIISSKFGNIPVAIVDDCNVGAFWAAVEKGKGNVIGISMGTGTAIGYTDKKGRIRRFFTDIGKLIINMTRSDKKTAERLTGILGAASQHLSQQGVFRLAEYKGLDLDQYKLFVARKFADPDHYDIDISGIDDDRLIEHVRQALGDSARLEYENALESDAEKLEYAQSLLDSDSGELREKAEEIFDEIGVFLADTISVIYKYFDKSGTDDYVLFGRVVNGKAGDRIKVSAKGRLAELAPEGKSKWLRSVDVRLAKEIEGGENIDGMAQAIGAAYLGYQKSMSELREMVDLVVEDQRPFDAMNMIFEGRYTERDLPVIFTKACNELIAAVKEDNMRYIEMFLRYILQRSFRIKDEEISESIQIITGQALNVISWIDRGVPGAKEIRVTCDERQMVSDERRGMSYLDKGSVPTEEITDTVGEPGFYWRGSEGIERLAGNRMEAAMYDSDQYHKDEDKLIMYIMDHGFMDVPSGISGLTESGKISTIHETSFVNDYIPGSIQAASTGKGHYQGAYLDIKHVTSGEGIQFNVRYNESGRILEVKAHYITPGSWTVALPGYVDYMVSLGGLRFNDISVKLEQRHARRFNRYYDMTRNDAIARAFKRSAFAPYNVVRTSYIEKDGEVYKGIYMVKSGRDSFNMQWFNVEKPYREDTLLEFYSNLTDGNVNYFIDTLSNKIKNGREQPDKIKMISEAFVRMRVDQIKEIKTDHVNILKPSPCYMYDEYGGRAIERLLERRRHESGEPLAAVWFNSIHKNGLSRIEGTRISAGRAEMPELTLREILDCYPEMLGSYPDKPFAVKFSCTRFDPKVLAGFNRDLQPDEFIRLLQRERELIEMLNGVLSVGDEEEFRKFKSEYEEWVDKQTYVLWTNDGYLPRMEPYVDAARFNEEKGINDIDELTEKIRSNRAEIVKVLNRISLDDAEIIIAPAGVPHETLGLSLHMHPMKGPDARSDALVVIPLRKPSGEVDHVVVEAIQPSDVVYSIADFYMPIVWDERNQSTMMRKDITADMIKDYVKNRLRHEVTGPEDYVLKVDRTEPVYENKQYGSLLERLVQGPYGNMWPEVYFIVERITLEKPENRETAKIELAPMPGIFYELVVTEGSIDVTVGGKTETIDKGFSAYIPADSTDRVTIATKDKAQVLMFYKPSLIVNKVASLIEQLDRVGVSATVNNRRLKEMRDSPVDLYEWITAYTALKDPEDIESILQARLDIHNGRAPPEIFGTVEVVELIYNALFNQEQLQEMLKYRREPINIVMLRGGSGAGDFATLVKDIPGVNVKIVLSGTDDGRSWFEAARDFNATGVPDCGKSLLYLSENKAVYNLLDHRLQPKVKETKEKLVRDLRKDLDRVIRRLEGETLSKAEGIKLPVMLELFDLASKVDPEKLNEILKYVKVFVKTLDTRYSSSGFNLINVTMRNIVILGAAWHLEEEGHPNYWQDAVDVVAGLLDVKEGNRVLLATEKRVHLMAMTSDGTVFFTETGINEHDKEGDFIGVWLVDRALDIDEFEESLPNGIKLDRLKLKKRDPEIETTTRKVNVDGLDVQERDERIRTVAREIAKRSLTDPDYSDPARRVRITDEVRMVLEEADVIVCCPTTLESNLGSTLIIGGVQEAINDNDEAIKMYFVNPTIEHDRDRTKASDVLERFYRCLSNQHGYEHPMSWAGLNKGLDYIIGMAMKYGKWSSTRRYIPFDEVELARIGVEPIGLDIEQEEPQKVKVREYEHVAYDWGFYSEPVMLETLFMLWTLKIAGLSVSKGKLKRMREPRARQITGLPVAQRRETGAMPAIRDGEPGPVGKKVDPGAEYSGLWQAELKDGVIGEGAPYDKGEKHSKYSWIKRNMLQEVISGLRDEFGTGLLGVVDAVRVVDNIRAEILQKGENGVLPYTMMAKEEGRNILLVDVDLFPKPGARDAARGISKIVMYINLLHEFEESIMTIVPYESEAVRELTMNVRSLRFVLGLIKAGRIDIDDLMEKLPDLGADIQFLSAIKVLQAMGEEITDNNIIAVALEHMRNMHYYRDFFNEFGFAKDWAGEIGEVENRYEAAVSVFDEIMEARLGDGKKKEESQDELREVVREVEVNIKVVETFTGKKRISKGLEVFSRQLQKVIGTLAKGIWARESMRESLKDAVSGKETTKKYWIVIDKERQDALEEGVELKIMQKQIEALSGIVGSDGEPVFKVVGSLDEVVDGKAFSETNPRVIRLIGFEDVDGLEQRTDMLYLPTIYTSGSIYLAAHLVLAGGDVEAIGDKMVKGILKGLCDAVCEGRDVDDLYNLLFRKPWKIKLVAEQLDELRIAVFQIEKAA